MCKGKRAACHKGWISLENLFKFWNLSEQHLLTVFFLFQYTLSQIEMYLGVAKPVLQQNYVDTSLYRFITNTIKIQNEYILSVQPKHAPNSDSKTHAKNKIRPLELK